MTLSLSLYGLQSTQQRAMPKENRRTDVTCIPGCKELVGQGAMVLRWIKILTFRVNVKQMEQNLNWTQNFKSYQKLLVVHKRPHYGTTKTLTIVPFHHTVCHTKPDKSESKRILTVTVKVYGRHEILAICYMPAPTSQAIRANMIVDKCTTNEIKISMTCCESQPVADSIYGVHSVMR